MSSLWELQLPAQHFTLTEKGQSRGDTESWRLSPNWGFAALQGIPGMQEGASQACGAALPPPFSPIPCSFLPLPSQTCANVTGNPPGMAFPPPGWYFLPAASPPARPLLHEPSQASLVTLTPGAPLPSCRTGSIWQARAAQGCCSLPGSGVSPGSFSGCVPPAASLCSWGHLSKGWPQHPCSFHCLGKGSSSGRVWGLCWMFEGHRVRSDLGWLQPDPLLAPVYSWLPGVLFRGHFEEETFSVWLIPS